MKRQKHLQKRLLSLLCCLCLVVGLFVPMGSVSAAGAEITVSKAVQTPFVKKAAEGTPALQGVDATITAAADGTVEITATVAAKGKTLTYTERVEVKSGTNTVRIHVPDTHELLEPTETATLTLSEDNAVVYTDEQWQRTRHWTFYLSQTMHCDLGYTNYQEDLPALYSSFIETVKQYMEDTDAQIEEEGWTELYKYAIEGQWVMQGYMEEMNAEDVQEVLDLIEEGRMIIGGGMGNQAQECFSTEDTARAAYYTNRYLVDKLGVDPTTTQRMFDNPAFTKSYVDVANSAGIKYGIHSMNPDHSPYHQRRLYDLFYMDGNVKGNKLLIFNGKTYGENYGFGGSHGGYGDGDANQAYNSIMSIISDLESRTGRMTYYYDMFPMPLIPYGDNKGPKAEQIIVGNQVNDKVKDMGYDYPYVKAAFPEEFFEDVEAEYGDLIPHEQGTEENWWNHGWGTTAYESGVNKLAGAELPVAETAASLATALTGKEYPYDDLYEGVYRTQVYDEHTWGYASYNGGLDYRTQWEWKRSNAFGAKALADKVLEGSLDALAKDAVTTGNTKNIYVYNGLNWIRSDVVTMELPEGFSETSVIMDGETSIPYSVTNGMLSFVVENVPAMGYKLLTVQAGTPATGSGVTSGTDYIENEFYKVTFAPDGTISSIIDKTHKHREMVAQDTASNGDGEKFNQYRYYDCNSYNVNAMYTPDPAVAMLDITSDGVKATATVKTSAFRASSITQTVTLYDGIPRIDIVNEVVKEDLPSLRNATEDAFYTFPFAVDGEHEMRYDLPVGNTAEGDQVDGTSHDWYTFNKWVSVRDLAEGYNMVLASPNTALMQFGERRTESWSFDYISENPYLYSYVFNNMWQTNFQADQPGYADFRYSISSNTAGADMEENNRFGWEVVTPLQATVVDGTAQKASDSYFKIDNSNVTVSTMKAAEANGEGMILRFTEVAGKGGTVNVTLPYSAAITETDIIENNLTGGVTASGTTFTFTVEPYEFKTFRIVKSDAAALGQVTGVTAVTGNSGSNLLESSTATASTEYDSNYSASNAKNTKGGEWASKGEKNPWITFTWTTPQKVKTLKILDRSGGADKIDSATITLKNGNTQVFQETYTDIPQSGTPKTITLDNEVTVTEIRVDLAAPNAQNAGLQGVEAYSEGSGNNLPGTKISWNAVAGASYYQVFRSTDPNFTPGSGNHLGNTVDLNYYDSQVRSTLSSKYYYAVRAVGTGTAGVFSAKVGNSVGTLQDTTDPGKPVVHAVVRADDRVDLWWTPVQDDVYVDHYEIYRDGEQLTVERPNGYVVSYRDYGVTPGSSPEYKVVAVDAGGNRTESDVLTITSKDETPVQLTSLTVKIGDQAAALSPVFSPSNSAYSIAVGKGKLPLLPEVTVTATAPDGAVLTIDGNSAESGKPVTLSVDPKNPRIIIKVTNGGLSKAYAITFTENDPLIAVADVTASETYTNIANMEHNLINGSGMSNNTTVSATHDNNGGGTTMWHTNGTVGQPVWVMFDFGSVYSLDKMYVWNMNQISETVGDLTTRGFKNVKIEYSENGTDWTALTVPEGMTFESDGVTADYPFQFAKASGAAQEPASNLNDGKHSPVDFGGVEAQYVRITTDPTYGVGSWGREGNNDDKYIGLSEVRFTSKIPYGDAVNVTDITIESDGDTITVPHGTLQLTAKVTPEDATYPDVTWSVEGDAATISQSGLLTARKNGTVTVTAAAQDESGVKATKEITVSGQPVVIEGVKATAGEYYNQGKNEYQAPTNVVNDSGMSGKGSVYDTHDNHVSAETMWHTDARPGEDAWITFDLGTAQPIGDMYVWNINQSANVDRGLKNVKIEYSSDGETWKNLSNEEGYPFVLHKANGKVGLGYTDKIALNVTAQYVRITADPTIGQGNYGSEYYGLSEVRFTVGEEQPVEPTITVTPATATVEPGETLEFTATITNGEDQTVVWSLTGNNSEETTLVNGLLTVAEDETAETLTITATSETYQISASAAVTVTGGTVDPEVHTITLDPNGGRVEPDTLTVKDGETVALPTPTRFGSFRFVGWFTASGKEVTDETHIYEDLNLVARWQYTGGIIIPIDPGTPSYELPFVDVPEGEWYYESVYYAWDAGLIDGTSATTFRPDHTLTVAQTIKLAAALHQLTNEGRVTLENGTDNWYDTYVVYAVKEGIIEAKYQSYTQAQMNTPAKRNEFVHILHGALDEYEAINSIGDNAIPDVKIGDAYAAEIYDFYRAGILTGSNAEGTFHPESSIKRSEVAAILVRMHDSSMRLEKTL